MPLHEGVVNPAVCLGNVLPSSRGLSASGSYGMEDANVGGKTRRDDPAYWRSDSIRDDGRKKPWQDPVAGLTSLCNPISLGHTGLRQPVTTQSSPTRMSLRNTVPAYQCTGTVSGNRAALICLNLGRTVDRGIADQNAEVFQCDDCGRKMGWEVSAVGGLTPPDALERRPPQPCRHCGCASWPRIVDAPDPQRAASAALPVGVTCPAP